MLQAYNISTQAQNSNEKKKTRNTTKIKPQHGSQTKISSDVQSNPDQAIKSWESGRNRQRMISQDVITSFLNED